MVIQERNSWTLPQVTYTQGKDLRGSLEGAGGTGGLLARTDNWLLNSGSPPDRSRVPHRAWTARNRWSMMSGMFLFSKPSPSVLAALAGSIWLYAPYGDGERRAQEMARKLRLIQTHDPERLLVERRSPTKRADIANQLDRFAVCKSEFAEYSLRIIR